MSESARKTITKKELVHRIAEATGEAKVVVKDILQRFLDEIITELAGGSRLEFREFGVFEVRERAARTAQNPRTLSKVPVAARRVVKFKAGRTLREKVCDEPPKPPRAAKKKPVAGDARVERASSAVRPPSAPKSPF